MTIGGLTLDGNVLEIAVIAATLTLMIAAFLTGRLVGLKRRGAEQRSIEALRTVRAKEETRLDELRKQGEGLRRDELRAKVALERWETVKHDHQRLEDMRRELDEFEREESRRVDELERRRAEAARRLGDVQSALDAYPPETTKEDSAWKKELDSRKRAYDELLQKTKDAEKNYADVDARRTQAAEEAAKIERKKSRLDEEIEAAGGLLEQLKRGQIDILKPHNERLLDERSQLQGELDELNDELKAKKEELDAAKQATRKGPDGAGKMGALEKLSAFRSIPGCLLGYDVSRKSADEGDLLRELEETLGEQGMQYPTRIVYAFHTALKVNDLSPLTVLSGLSGTGKSQLPRVYARFFGIHFLHVPVEPGWDSPQDLLGFYDFVAERYRPTDRARALGHFDKQFATEVGIEVDRNWDDRMLVILLDEMNLARTEYYFSEFLSRLEMRGPRGSGGVHGESRGDAQIAIDLPYAEGEPPKHLYVPHNVLWVGTLNEDETTQALSDKVLDRANSIRFAPPNPGILRKHSTAPMSSISAADGYLPYERWLEWSNRRTMVPAGPDIDGAIEELARLMQRADRGFGYRIAQSIRAYIDRYPGQDWRVPMVDQINMRLLPKLAGSEMTVACRETLEEMKRLSEELLGDRGFAEALRNAVEASEAAQIFTWPGYMYE